MINQKLNDVAIPAHDYDGIQELNNPAPYWIIFLFLGTIAFSLFYAVHYFGYPNNGRDQISEYNQEVAMAQKMKDQQNQNGGAGAAVVDAKQMIADGAKIFTEKGCIACHGMKGEGNAIGPNLTDNYWINGCKIENLIKIINEGKPEKGMTPFKGILTDAQIKSVATYILSLVGTNPPNAKAPQGVACK